MSDIQDFKKLVEVLCTEDHVGLWLIVNHVRERFPDSSAQEIRQITLGVLDELLEKGIIQAGFPTPDGRSFEPWTTPAADTISRIEDAWEALHRDPTIGEVVWFTTPEE